MQCTAVHPGLPWRTRAMNPSGHDKELAYNLSVIDWELGVVDLNCRKLLRVLHGSEPNVTSYAGTSALTEAGRAKLREQLDGLQLEKAQHREKKLALLQKKRAGWQTQDRRRKALDGGLSYRSDQSSWGNQKPRFCVPPLETDS